MGAGIKIAAILQRKTRSSGLISAVDKSGLWLWQPSTSTVCDPGVEELTRQHKVYVF